MHSCCPMGKENDFPKERVSTKRPAAWAQVPVIRAYLNCLGSFYLLDRRQWWDRSCKNRTLVSHCTDFYLFPGFPETRYLGVNILVLLNSIKTHLAGLLLLFFTCSWIKLETWWEGGIINVTIGMFLIGYGTMVTNHPFLKRGLIRSHHSQTF